MTEKKGRWMSFEKLAKATQIELVYSGEIKNKYGYYVSCDQIFIYHPRRGTITLRRK